VTLCLHQVLRRMRLDEEAIRQARVSRLRGDAKAGGGEMRQRFGVCCPGLRRRRGNSPDGVAVLWADEQFTACAAC